MSLKVAILEDEQAQSELVQSWLSPEQFEVSAFFTGQSLLDALEDQSFDLLMVDWELPDINGPDVMRKMRLELNIESPIIFITSRDSEEDIVSALEAGADDYLVKPVRQHELLARIKSNTRRLQPASQSGAVEAPPYRFTPDNEQAFINDTAVELSSKEFELALYLFRNSGKLLERKHILAEVWKQEAELNTRTVDTHVSVIRKKLSIGPQHGWRLKSVYGHGYRLERLENNE